VLVAVEVVPVEVEVEVLVEVVVEVLSVEELSKYSAAAS
jgi:hypothetical protein